MEEGATPLTSMRSPATTMASGRTVGWLLDLRAEQRGDHPFLVWEPFSGQAQTWSYGEFASQTREIAAGLQRRGLRAGQRVILHLENSPEFLLSWFACTRAGVVPVCTNTRSVADELAYFAEHSNAVASITQPSFAELVNSAAPQLEWIAVTETDAGEPPAPGVSPSPGDSFSSLGSDAADFVSPELHAFSPASIQYTSGTTARPKAVVWTQANCLWGAKVSAAHETLTPDDVHLVHLPLFHTNAQSYSVLASLGVGATMVLQPRFSASRFWDVSLRNRCTWTSVIMFCVNALASVDVPRQHTYRLWGNGVGSPPQDEQFGVHTIGWWGMTETVSHGIVDDVYNLGRSLGCGRPAPEYEVAVLRADGTAVEPEETGELLVRGAPGVSLFAGYLHDDEATRRTVDPNGWLTTGDLVTVHADGSITFADRAKDMLKVGGENVAASEIEVVLLGEPAVSEVAVVAAADPMLGDVPVAFVIVTDARDGLADDLLAVCKERLADFKVPQEVRIVDELPRSTLNKIAKAELRKQLATEAERDEAGR
jgi:carnitine-CoA ligase